MERELQEKIQFFQDLVEVQGLCEKSAFHQKKIEEQKSRINKVQKEKELKLQLENRLSSELKNKQKQYSEKEKSLETIDRDLKKAQDRISALTSSQEVDLTEKEITSLSDKKEILEEEVFLLLEEIEILEQDLQEGKEFLLNVEDSISEITKEAESEIAKEEKEIANYYYRKELLIKQLPQEMARKFLSAQKRQDPHSALATIEKDRCSGCHMGPMRQMAFQLEVTAPVQSCPHCGRVFIPHKALNR